MEVPSRSARKVLFAFPGPLRDFPSTPFSFSVGDALPPTSGIPSTGAVSPPSADRADQTRFRILTDGEHHSRTVGGLGKPARRRRSSLYAPFSLRAVSRRSLLGAGATATEERAAGEICLYDDADRRKHRHGCALPRLTRHRLSHLPALTVQHDAPHLAKRIIQNLFRYFQVKYFFIPKIKHGIRKKSAAIPAVRPIF